MLFFKLVTSLKFRDVNTVNMPEVSCSVDVSPSVLMSLFRTSGSDLFLLIIVFRHVFMPRGNLFGHNLCFAKF